MRGNNSCRDAPSTARPMAATSKGESLSLHRTILHRVRTCSVLYPLALHRLGVAPRLGPPRRSDLRRTWTTTSRLLTDDPRFWNSVREHDQHLVASRRCRSSSSPSVLARHVSTSDSSEARRSSGWRSSFRTSHRFSQWRLCSRPSSVGTTGLVNWILELASAWRESTGRAEKLVVAHLAIATMVAWRWTGYNTLIYLAAMQAIPRQLYEAAMIDGASRWRQFVHVTVPQLRPTIIFTVIISTIGGLQIFAEPLVFGENNGGTKVRGPDASFRQ